MRLSRLSRLHLPQSLRGQFSLALLALSLLIVAGGLGAVQALRNSAESSRQLAEERLERLQDAENLVHNTLLIERESYRMLTVDSLDGMQRSYEEIIKQMTSLDSLVVRLSHADTDIAVLTLNQTGQLFRNTAHIVARLRQKILKNGAADADRQNLGRFQGQLEQQVTAMAAAAVELSARLTRDYRERIEQLAATSKRDQHLVLTLITGSLILAWLISRYFLGRHVVTRLQQVSRYLRIGDTGNAEIRVPVQGNDEIGNMARAVEQFLEDRRRLAETQLSLQQSEEMLRAITDAVQSAVFLIDDEDRIQFVNPAAGATFGYSREEMIGYRLHEIIIPERFRQQAREGLSAYSHTGEGPMLGKPQEMIARHKSGKELTILIQVGRIYKEGRWWAVGSAVDITERLEAEADLKRAQNEALHAARLASVGQLAAGIAHEINTPAQYVSDNLRFIDEAVNSILPVLSVAQNLAKTISDRQTAAAFDDSYEKADVEYLVEELPAAIRQSLDGIGKVSQIVRSMKEFSHPGGGAKELADINKAIENAITITRSTWKEAATVEPRFDPDLPQVYCSIGEMNQVFLNLIVNAAHAIEQAKKPEMGTIAIETRVAGDEVLIAVADTGGGIPAAIREHIFDPFFTTKSVGKGSGQGLAICYDIVVNKHKGRIEVGGVPGQGAVFTVYLPIRTKRVS